MNSKKVMEIVIARQIAVEGTRTETWTVDKKYLHNLTDFSEWFCENKHSLPDRILKSDAYILERYIEDTVRNTGDCESDVWTNIIAEVCSRDSEVDDDDLDEVYGANSEYSCSDITSWCRPSSSTVSSLVTESDTEPEPEPVAQEVAVAEPISEGGNNAHFIALINRQKQFMPEDTTIRVTPETLGKLMEYANARWHTAHSGDGELLGREWDIVQAVLHNRELWAHICYLIDRKCYDTGLISIGEG